jgi:YVTN family beta-propeller protein
VSVFTRPISTPEASLSLPRRTRLASLIAMSLGLVVYACTGQDATGPASMDGASGFSFAAIGAGGPPMSRSVCGVPTTVDLISGPGAVVGSVVVTNDGALLSVVYRTTGPWQLNRLHLFVGGSLDALPTNPAGRPQVGRFPYAADPPEGTRAWEVTLDLAGAGLGFGDDVIVAANAQVIDPRDPSTPDDDVVEGAWGDGTPLVRGGRGNTGSYFSHEVQPCTTVSREVGPDGGSLEAVGTQSGGRAALLVPPRALDATVEITIEAIPVDDLESPDAADVIIAGTAYDFGPDGLTFDEPVELVIGYREEDLGPDPAAVEPTLVIYSIGPPLEALPSVVDATANQVSTFIEHFSEYGIGPDSEDGIVEIFVNEQITVADAIDVPGTVRINVTEQISVTDAPSVSGPVSILVQEQIGVRDDVTPELDAPVRIEVFETIGVRDAVAARGPVSIFVEEQVGVLDDVTPGVASPVIIEVFETIGIQDDVAPGVDGPIAVPVNEGVTVADLVSVVVESPPPSAFAYVGAQGDDAVAVIDRVTNQVVTTLSVGNPFAMSAKPDGSQVYVGRGGDRAVDVIDVATNTVVETITPGFSVFDIEFTAAGDTAWASSGGSSSIIYPVSGPTAVRPPSIAVAPFSRGLTLSPSGDSAFVVSNDTVTVVDLTTRTVVDKWTGTFSGRDAAITPDGSTLVVTDGDGELEIFDVAAGTLVATVTVGAGAYGVAIDPTGSTAYTADEISDRLSVVDLGSNTSTGSIPVGAGAEPYRITLSKDGSTAWVTQYSSSGGVLVVDLATGQVTATIAAGSFASDVALVGPVGGI